MNDSQPSGQMTKAVPLEPTQEMLWAGYQADAGVSETFDDFMALRPGWRDDILPIWRAMVAAAPKDANP